MGKMKKTMNRLFGFLPITRWEFNRQAAAVSNVVEGIACNEKQLSQLIKSVVDSMSEKEKEAQVAKPEEKEEKDDYQMYG